MAGELIAFGVLGAATGLGSGALAVFLEKRERLQEEDIEDYELDVAAANEAAAKAGKDSPEPPPPGYDRYGWTWLEWGLSPAVGAGTFAWFASAGYGVQNAAPSATVLRLLIIHLVWLAIFIHIAVFDIKHRLILNQMTYPAIALALIVSMVTPHLGIEPAAAGALLIWGIFMGQNLVFGSGVIGRGDAKLGAIVGAVTGLGPDWGHVGALWAVIIAFFLGGLGAIVILLGWSLKATLAARRPLDVPRLFFRQLRLSMKEPIPYGPFICAGAVLLLLQNIA